MNDELLAAEALLLARGYLYELFHKALGGYPTAELVEVLVSPATFDALDEYAASGEKLSELRLFLEALAERVADEAALGEFVEAARDEYSRLFVGPGALPVQPMETPHVAHEMVLFSENTVAVRRIYKSQGLVPVRVLHVADDHVSLMCDFMARLASETLGAFQDGNAESVDTLATDQAAFAAAHMANWLPRFAQLQSELPNPVLYPQLAAALAEFVNLDILFLSEIIAWVAESPEWEPAGQRPDSFGDLEKALDSLKALRLFGLEDCELTALS